MKNAFNNELTTKYQPQHCIDASGLHCPLPLLKLKKGLAQINTDENLYIITTDENSPLDIQRFCARSDYTILETVQEDTVCHMVIKR